MRLEYVATEVWHLIRQLLILHQNVSRSRNVTFHFHKKIALMKMQIIQISLSTEHFTILY
jgi:hypothetical protein